ncbi:hypothetical protein BGZ73_003725 [Actinomortierella ambigua]|nr:hypothetical protein BGZ73_003725 [Actinomortierella ambigua]
MVEENNLWPEDDNASIYAASTIAGGSVYGDYDDDLSEKPNISRRSSLSSLCTLTPAPAQSPPQSPLNSTSSITEEDSKIFKELLLAAEKGDPKAQVEVDDGKALSWFYRAAEQGYADGQYMVGHMYKCGLGVKSDDEEAVAWYRKAAAQGHITAKYHLGSAYLYGQGVERDYVQAVHWIEASASEGNPYAQCSLGYLYEHGFAIDMDLDRAIYWVGKAAEQDFSFSRKILKDLLQQKAKHERKQRWKINF